VIFRNDGIFGDFVAPDLDFLAEAAESGGDARVEYARGGAWGTKQRIRNDARKVRKRLQQPEKGHLNSENAENIYG